MTLFEKLQKRLSNSPSEINRIIHVIEKYDLNINIRCFDSHGLILFDQRGKTVRIVFGTKEQVLIRTPLIHAHIAIVFLDDIIAGWIESDRTEQDGSICFIDPNTLHTMPSEFVFIQECPHMDIYGGFTDGEYWTCANCKEKLVLNDS